MSKVGIAGYSTIPFSVEPTQIESLLLSSVRQIFTDTKNLAQKDIDAVLVSTNENKKYLASIVSELSDISPKISHTIESLCSSGTNSIVSAFSYIAAGLADVVLVVGAERFDGPGQTLDWDTTRGEFKHPIFWGSIFTKAHKRKYNTTNEQLAYVSAKNHRHSLDNPSAYKPKTYTIDEIMNSKKITDDLRLLDCSRPCTGGSAILLASENIVKKFTDFPIWIKGIGQKTTSASFANNDLTKLDSVIAAATQAYSMAKIAPDKIDVAEIHDAFSVCELMILEDIGFTQKGQAGEYVKEMYETNNKRVNPRGGLIGTGHPLGATGIAQVAEIASQLQSKSQKRQVEHARTGLVQNMSAAGTSSTVVILES